MRRLFGSIFARLRNTCIDAVLPISCLGCDRDGVWLCCRCRGTIEYKPQLTCFGCNRPSPDGRFCVSCRGGKALEGIWSVASYGQPILRAAIARMKYSGAHALAQPLAAEMAEFIQRWPFLFSLSPLCVPVPLHRRRLHERGFNQAHLVTHHLAAYVPGLRCGCTLLARRRATRPQVKCNRETRFRNVSRAFAYAGPVRRVTDERIILIDDVATTGSTLEQCALSLRQAGFKDVWGFVLAKG